MGLEYPDGFADMAMKPNTPKVGVGVILVRYNHERSRSEILLQLRKGSHGAGEWSIPGGHVDVGEELEESCRREVEEETGIIIDECRFFDMTNDIMKNEGLHYVTLFFKAKFDQSQEFEIREPDKCADMKWIGENEIPDELFRPLENVIENNWRNNLWT